MILAIILIRKINNISINKPSYKDCIYYHYFGNFYIKHPKRLVTKNKNIEPIYSEMSCKYYDKVDVYPKMQRNTTIISKMMAQLNNRYDEDQNKKENKKQYHSFIGNFFHSLSSLIRKVSSFTNLIGKVSLLSF